MDARLPERGTDALVVRLEHADGPAVSVVQPYHRSPLLRRLRIDARDRTVQERRAAVWRTDEAAEPPGLTSVPPTGRR